MLMQIFLDFVWGYGKLKNENENWSKRWNFGFWRAESHKKSLLGESCSLIFLFIYLYFLDKFRSNPIKLFENQIFNWDKQPQSLCWYNSNYIFQTCFPRNSWHKRSYNGCSNFIIKKTKFTPCCLGCSDYKLQTTYLFGFYYPNWWKRLKHTQCLV